jgi:hypothetical protein
MTLTAILPTLRASVPDPLDPSAWPAHTEPTVDDVRVAAVSMSRLAAIAGTPCVHSAEQAPPRYRSRDWSPRGMSVAVAAVTAVHRTADGVVVELDAVLPDCAVTGEARLIGRRTTAAPVVVTVVTTGSPDGVSAAAVTRMTVPRDVAVGDLVCLPCSQAVTHRLLTGATAATGVVGAPVAPVVPAGPAVSSRPGSPAGRVAGARDAGARTTATPEALSGTAAAR